MSLKDLFSDITRTGTTTTASSPDIKEISDNVESENYAWQVTRAKDRFIPHLDFSKPENFAKYGSAEEYYTKAIENIYSYYPYDGSLKEKEAWLNTSSYLDIYIFENEYPRTNGYIIMSADGWGTQDNISAGYGTPSTFEYIQVKSGPHKKNIWDSTEDREGNLKFDLSTGTTVEFWLKKDEFLSSLTSKEVIFDLWNGKHYNEHDYGRLRIELSGNAGTPKHSAVFRVTALSGTAGFHQAPIDENTTEATMTGSDGWSHYAFAMKNSGGGVAVEMYKNGSYVTTVLTGSTLNQVTGSLIANIGALRTATLGTTAATGSGKLSGSLDEFRYWKTRRTSRDIGRYYISQVGGGSNTDTANTDLGLYYKFNEGIVGNSSFDSVVLDYSGRLSNGTWTGYTTSSRNTGSAMVLSGKTTFEFKDPIIYKQNPKVSAYTTMKSVVGEAYDIQNPSSFYKSFPTWIVEEDDESGTELKKLTQIMSSYFDQLHNQIENLPHIKDKFYPSSSAVTDAITGSFKPYPFARRLLTSNGFRVPELFVDVSILETFDSRDEKIKYQDKIYNTKNLIYQNLYNNLFYIYKTKGTSQAVRNLVRAFGADGDIVNINVYSDGMDYQIRKNVEQKTLRKKVFNFNRSTRDQATIYQYQTGSGTTSVISGSSLTSLTVPNTVECEALFPLMDDEYNPNYYAFHDVSSSIFGQHTADVSLAENDLTWNSDDIASFQVYAVRNKLLSKDAYFVLTGSNISPITSSVYKNVYTNEKWNFAVRIRPSSAFGDLVYDGGALGYKVELYGVNSRMGSIENEFLVSGSMTTSIGQSFMNASKRLYAGAHRTNFSGALLKSTDAKISYLRYWLADIDNTAMREHSLGMHSYGPNVPLQDAISTYSTLAQVQVPALETLALNWNFDIVSSSADSSGRVLIEDFSSGSSDLTSRYGWIGNITKQNYTGRADFFQANEADVSVNEYIFSTQNRLPEIFYTDDMISIGEDEDKIFTKDTRPVEYYFAIENSPYRVISQEILNIFSSVVDFNNLIGEPVNKYRQEYKDLAKLRQLFFERVENEPDAERYLNYFKHVDAFIQDMLGQIMPASANVSETALNIIESHILERNKYVHKFPTAESKQGDPEATATGVNDLLFDWEHGHAPVGASAANQAVNCLYWHDLAERGGSAITSGDATINSQRETIKRIVNTVVSGSTYATRKLGRPYKFMMEQSDDLNGGVNLKSNKLFDFYRPAIKFNDPNSYIKIPFSTLKTLKTCADANIPPPLLKRKVDVQAITYDHGEPPRAYDYRDAKSSLLLPFTIFSSSVATGYLGELNVANTASFENLHVDADGGKLERPMQGPFTEKYVGGLQYRHATVNYSAAFSDTYSGKSLDQPLSRAEGWLLKLPVSAGTSATLLSESFSATDPVGWTNVGSTATGPSGWILTHSGPTPSVGTGPNAAAHGTYYAYSETSTPNYPGKTFGLVTPVIDANDLSGVDFSASFYYHMYGAQVGNLRVQHCEDSTFTTTITDLSVEWDWVLGSGGSPATFIAGQQQPASSDPYKQAAIDLTSYAGTEFYLRFLYEGGITYLSDVAIDMIEVSGTSGGTVYKLIDPAWDNANKPRATYYRDEVAKRPLNIRNIKMSGSGSITVIGNYSHNYEVVNTPGRNVNNIWFVQNSGSVGETETISLFISGNYDYSLKDRSTLQDGSKNRTVIAERFSAPGGPEVMSRGFLDVATETYSVYNCLNYRNSTVRNALNIWEKHHSIWGGYDGVYGVPTASFHKVQRNTGLRIELSGNLALVGEEIGMPVVTASYYDNGFISHQIPQTSAGYAWISGSIIGSII